MKYTMLVFSLLISSTLLGQPTLSLTFDDGITHDRAGYKFEEWNEMLLDHLDKAGVKAVFFIKGEDKSTKKGKFLLNSWNSRGHKIANHTYSHLNYNNEKVSAAMFREELLRNDSIINQYSNYMKLFRFPYLKEGNTKPKIDSIRQILTDENYNNGHVTIDASDWYIDSRLRKRLRKDPSADIKAFKNFYLAHLFDRATYYEDLSFKLTNRHISHTLLLHHNLAAALFLDDLIEMFKSKGWKIVSADMAFQDPVYEETTKHAGESLIWALAKDSGKFDEQLRYPAEDSRYERGKMDALGL